MFVVIGSIGVLISWTLATLKFLAARWIHRYCCYRFCIVVAALDCLNMPLGTILGIFTILVLAQPAVRARFEGMLSTIAVLMLSMMKKTMSIRHPFPRATPTTRHFPRRRRHASELSQSGPA